MTEYEAYQEHIRYTHAGYGRGYVDAGPADPSGIFMKSSKLSGMLSVNQRKDLIIWI